MTFLVGYLKSDLFVGALRRCVANDNADLREAVSVPPPFVEHLVEQRIYQSASTESRDRCNVLDNPRSFGVVGDTSADRNKAFPRRRALHLAPSQFASHFIHCL